MTKFFVTSVGVGKGGDLGGLAGADAHCQALAKAEGSGDHTWRAYLSTTATETAPAVNGRDRIGTGPWYNAEGLLVAANVVELHGPESKISKETAVTERLDTVNGVGDDPNNARYRDRLATEWDRVRWPRRSHVPELDVEYFRTRAGRSPRPQGPGDKRRFVELGPNIAWVRSAGPARHWRCRIVLLFCHRLVEVAGRGTDEMRPGTEVRVREAKPAA